MCVVPSETCFPPATQQLLKTSSQPQARVSQVPKMDMGSELSLGESVVKSCNNKMLHGGRLPVWESRTLTAWVPRTGTAPAPHQYQMCVKKLEFLKKYSFSEEICTFASEIQPSCHSEVSIFQQGSNGLVNQSMFYYAICCHLDLNCQKRDP